MWLVLDCMLYFMGIYRDDKFYLDRSTCANSVDPGHTSPAWSLYCFLF